MLAFQICDWTRGHLQQPISITFWRKKVVQHARNGGRKHVLLRKFRRLNLEGHSPPNKRVRGRFSDRTWILGSKSKDIESGRQVSILHSLHGNIFFNLRLHHPRLNSGHAVGNLSPYWRSRRAFNSGNTPTGALTNPKNFDLTMNLNRNLI